MKRTEFPLPVSHSRRPSMSGALLGSVLFMAGLFTGVILCRVVIFWTLTP